MYVVLLIGGTFDLPDNKESQAELLAELEKKKRVVYHKETFKCQWSSNKVWGKDHMCDLMVRQKEMSFLVINM